MDWIIWLIVIVAIVGVIWWLLNRNSRSGAGSSTAEASGIDRTDFDASPQAAASRNTHDGALSGGSAAASAAAAATTGMPSAAGFSNAEPEAPIRAEEPTAGQPRAAGTAGQASADEWETQWSETAPAEPHSPAKPDLSHGAHTVQGDRTTPVAEQAPVAERAPAEQQAPVHHPEYTEAHAPTLPGAESAAAEAALLEGEHAPAPASQSAEPSGHLALDQPYGEGSAAPAADGSGPAGFTVKGDASSMTYHEETSPSYDQTRAEVWFLSVAHAEAAGFRPPRRSRQ